MPSAAYRFIMTRPIRIEYPGALYHVTSRGNARQKIFLDDKDRLEFLKVLHEVITRSRWLVHAYCLMGNHYHLLIETPQADLSRGMRQLNGIYTQRSNKLHDRVGHIFQGRYKAYLVEKESYFLELCRYIVLNPVRARLIQHPEDWRWSSYRETVGEWADANFILPDFLLGHFSSDREKALELYKRFILDGMGKASPLKEAKGGILLGSDGFVVRWRPILKERGNEENIRQERYAGKPSLEEIFSRVSREKGIADAVNKWGYKLKEVGVHLNLHYSRVSRIASKMAKSKT